MATTCSYDDTYAALRSRMEWVAVFQRNDTTSTSMSNWTNSKENTEDSSVFESRWSFKNVFDELDQLNIHPETSVVATTSIGPVSQKFNTSLLSNMDHYYFDKSNGRCGIRVSDTEDNSVVNNTIPTDANNTSNSIDIAHGSILSMRHEVSRKRKRTDCDLWKVRYVDSTIIATNKAPMNDTNNAYTEEAIKMIDPRHLIPIYKHNTISNALQESCTKIPILITDTTDIYRLLAASQIHPLHNYHNLYDDTDVAVLEIGSSTGMTSSVVWQQLQNRQHGNNHYTQQRRWIGLDTGADMVQIVQEKLKTQNVNISVDDEWATCHHIDPLLDPDTASSLVLQHLLSRCTEPTTGNSDRVGTRKTQQVTVLIDIGGNREEGAVLRMVDWVIRTFQSSLVLSMNYCQLSQIIIKSESIYSTLTSYIKNKQQSTRGGANVQSAMDWYMTRLRIALRGSLPKHPLQAPKRFLLPIAMTSRRDASDIQIKDLMKSSEQQLICRYHNYHKAGCAKRNKAVVVDDNVTISGSNGIRQTTCPYDHDHCHVCLMPGHIARHCPLIFS